MFNMQVSRIPIRISSGVLQQERVARYVHGGPLTDVISPQIPGCILGTSSVHRKGILGAGEQIVHLTYSQTNNLTKATSRNTDHSPEVGVSVGIYYSQ